jgi:predicted alpha/beta-hydrolase family hydrolase
VKESLFVRPPDARFLYVLGHGAGAGMRHPFMEAMARALAARSIATWRWQMRYLTEGRKRPDPAATVVAEVRAAVAAARAAAPDLRLVAGGKSFGGRMTSTAESEAPLDVDGLVFLGFPLHPEGKPSTKRADHLDRVSVPMLFVSGDRDRLADLTLLSPIVASLPRATLQVVRGADHGLGVPKRSGRDGVSEAAVAIAGWLDVLTRPA